ncbi:MAG TPA: class I SAM-dependent methyltransferase, partial [Verrucomicrobiae bacterium]|nr:class I SAM-dependent methyltransferase [Verrucomicrobiae bacterium]
QDAPALRQAGTPAATALNRYGPPARESSGVPVVFLESGLRFEADVLRGQKTGFFLDQRENRRLVESLAKGREVLNAFSFTGGFSLYAARGGARRVTDLDISEHALAGAKRNFALSRDVGSGATHRVGSVNSCRHETIQADAFEWLEKAVKPRFDLVILDPPSLAKRESEREGAIRAYERLAADGIRLLRRDGILAAASCSAHVSAEDFYASVLRAAGHSGRQFREVERTGHPPDHPATFPEARYLKCVFLGITG